MPIILTPEERLLIGAGCLGLLLATALLLACKVIPSCPLYDCWACDGKLSQGEDDLKKRQKKAQYAQIYPEIQLHSANGPDKRTSLASHGSVGPYLSTDSASHRAWRGYQSTSGASSAEPSPAIRLTPAFTEFSADGVKESRGVVDFSLQYDPGEEKLHIHVIGAKQLPLSIYGSANDSFVKVLVIRDIRKRWLSPRPSALPLPELEQEATRGSAKFAEFRTRTIRRASSPVFDETFEASVRDKDRRHTVVKLMAYLTDRYAHHCLCGETTVQLKRENIAAKKTYGKELVKVEENIGDVTLCLTYLPTAGRLCLNLVKASNLKVSVLGDEALNPQVRASLLLRTKTLEKHKVRPQPNTRNPVYNQTLTFDIRNEELDRVMLLLTVLHKDLNEDPSESSTENDVQTPDNERARKLSRQSSSHSGLLKVRSGSASNITELKEEEEDIATSGSGKLVKSKSSLGLRSRTIVIGRVAFGTNARGSCRKHWEEVIHNPRKQFTRTHKLQS